jgi:hypothetical protein
MIVEFFVRIFIFGLSGFVLDDGRTTVLLPTVAHHKAFVAFANGSCSPKPCQKIGKFPGLELTGDQIDIPQLTKSRPQGHQRKPRPSIVRKLPKTHDITIPIGDSDAVAFDWVTPMGKLGNPGTVDKDCIAGPSNKTCNLAKGGLQGRMVLTSGLLSTCKLIETSTVMPECRGEVHTFHFDHTSGPVQQALAEIEVSVTKVTGSSVTLTLSKLGASQPWETVTLKPGTCVGGDPKAACVDIFVGNMPDTPILGDCSVQKRGDHFAALYGLLAPGFRGAQPIPIQDLKHSKPASSVQPVCRDVPSRTEASTRKDFQAPAEVPHLERLTVEDRKQEAAFGAYLRRVLFPNQRPICPMAAFNPPP